MYDAYISLGTNCEAGLNFRRIGYEVSSFFRFTSSSYESTMQLIERDFKDVYLKENIQPVLDHMIRDLGTSIVHHTALHSKEENGVRQFSPDYDFEEAYAKEASKIQYFVQKWNDLTASDQKVLYIFQNPHFTSRQRAEDMLALLRRKYPKHNCDLLYIQLEAHREPEWPTEGLFNRYFARFAPYDDAYSYDQAAWDRIFAEFPLKPTADRGASKDKQVSLLS